MARLELNAVGKSFGPVRCAEDLSLAVEPGEIVAVFGPSGSGKTVLLRMIAGMFEPDEGDILVGGQSIVDAPPERRGIGMAFQNFALFPHMSAQDNNRKRPARQGGCRRGGVPGQVDQPAVEDRACPRSQAP